MTCSFPSLVPHRFPGAILHPCLPYALSLLQPVSSVVNAQAYLLLDYRPLSSTFCCDRPLCDQTLLPFPHVSLTSCEVLILKDPRCLGRRYKPEHLTIVESFPPHFSCLLQHHRLRTNPCRPSLPHNELLPTRPALRAPGHRI